MRRNNGFANLRDRRTADNQSRQNASFNNPLANQPVQAVEQLPLQQRIQQEITNLEQVTHLANYFLQTPEQMQS